MLTSGLANVQSPLEQSRLHLALSDLHADSGAWVGAAASSRLTALLMPQLKAQ